MDDVLPMVTVKIAAALQVFAGKKASVAVAGSTVKEVMENLAQEYPQLRRSILREDGSLSSRVLISFNDQDIRLLDRENTQLPAGSEIALYPVLAGG